MPTHTSEIGIEEADLEEIAEKTLPSMRMARNNLRVTKKESLVELFGEALQGNKIFGLTGEPWRWRELVGFLY